MVSVEEIEQILLTAQEFLTSSSSSNPTLFPTNFHQPPPSINPSTSSIATSPPISSRLLRRDTTGNLRMVLTSGHIEIVVHPFNGEGISVSWLTSWSVDGYSTLLSMIATY